MSKAFDIAKLVYVKGFWWILRLVESYTVREVENTILHQEEKEMKILEVGTQIKKYRNDMKLSQEELAEKVYVSRQTISNWETGKNYPDIHSLLLLSSLFNISLDQLIKGDFEIMKEEIRETEMKKLDRYGRGFVVLLVATVLSTIPLLLWIGIYAFIPCGLLFGASLFFAYKTEKVKKDNNIHIYKEIVAFMEGKRLDEIEKQQEKGKRPYQSFILALSCGLITLIVSVLLVLIFSH